jgi:uncharacterized membrane protein YhaH (DUF805 family)
MAICNNCGRKYNRFLTPVSAKGVCSECFFAQLEAEASGVEPQPTEERASGRESQVGTPVDTPPQRAPAVPAAGDAADKHIRNAWIAAAVPAVFNLGLVIYRIAGGRDSFEIGNTGGSLVGDVLLLGLAFGVANHSRICAVGLVLWISAAIMKWIMMGSKLGAVGVGVGVGVGVIFLYFFVRGAIATFKYHAARPAVTRASVSYAHMPHFMRPLVEFIFPHRLHRLAYFLRINVRSVFLYFVYTARFPMAASVYTFRGTMADSYWSAAVIVLSLYGIFFILLPRLRDVGMSAWWLIVALIPVANGLLGIILLFRAPEYDFASPASETQET